MPSSQGDIKIKNSLKEKNKELKDFWKSHIKQWSKSDITQTNYHRHHNLSRHRFTYWERKFKQKNLLVKFVQITPDPVAIGLSNLKLNVAQRMADRNTGWLLPGDA
jgi:hypothetical protein